MWIRECNDTFLSGIRLWSLTFCVRSQTRQMYTVFFYLRTYRSFPKSYFIHSCVPFNQCCVFLFYISPKSNDLLKPCLSLMLVNVIFCIIERLVFRIQKYLLCLLIIWNKDCISYAFLVEWCSHYIVYTLTFKMTMIYHCHEY